MNEIILDKDKEETIKQWTNDPCGFVASEKFSLYSKEFFERIDKNRYEEYAPWMKKAMEFDRYSGKKVLEVGFGMGTDLFQFAKNGAFAHGVDITPRHFEIASKRFSSFGLSANLQIADAEALPFPDGQFDLVYTFGVIHHTPDTEKAIREIHRVLKPGGRAIIGVYHKNSYYYYRILIPFLLYRFLFESYRRTLSRIEYRQNSDACPLVKLYSRSQLGRMLQPFSTVKIECYHLSLGPLQRFVPSWAVKRLDKLFGWYLVAKCNK